MWLEAIIAPGAVTQEAGPGRGITRDTHLTTDLY